MKAVPALRFLLINIKFEMLYLISLNPNAVLFCISISAIMVGFYSLLPMKKSSSLVDKSIRIMIALYHFKKTCRQGLTM